MCTSRNCPDCGDRLIHQKSRTNEESSSALGQHIHDEFPKVFDWMDIDGVIYKSSKRLMRVIEHKDPGRQLSRSQSRVLPILAMGIQSQIDAGLLHERSGVYVTWTSAPFGTASVAQVLPGEHLALSPTVAMGSADFSMFKTGEIVYPDLDANREWYSSNPAVEVDQP